MVEFVFVYVIDDVHTEIARYARQTSLAPASGDRGRMYARFGWAHHNAPANMEVLAVVPFEIEGGIRIAVFMELA